VNVDVFSKCFWNCRENIEVSMEKGGKSRIIQWKMVKKNRKFI
jgi:hypothetical protein